MNTMVRDANVKAIWRGDADVLPIGAEVSVLGYDRFGDEVPARAAVWVRWVWQDGGSPRYRSCDIADLEISDADHARLTV